MLNLYRRHTPECAHREKGIQYTKCTCPIWVVGHLRNKPIRQTMKTRNWGWAEKELDRWLGVPGVPAQPQPDPTPEDKGKTVAETIKAYLASLRVRKLAASTIQSYKGTLDYLEAFLGDRGLTYIRKVELIALEGFQAQRLENGRKRDELTSNTQRKEMEHLRNLWAYALKHKWVDGNVARDLEAGGDGGMPTLPFERDEVHRLLDACDRIRTTNPKCREYSGQRMRALILTLCHSGLRISDAAQLDRTRLVNGSNGYELRLRQQKTGIWVTVSLPQHVVAALKAVPPYPGRAHSISQYFFWSGTSKLTTVCGSLRRSMDSLRELTGIHIHPHRFRDTFAVELLEQGEDIRTVQLLLGHTSVKTTEKHYAHYVKSTKDRLFAATAKLDFTTRREATTGQVIQFPAQP